MTSKLRHTEGPEEYSVSHTAGVSEIIAGRHYYYGNEVILSADRAKELWTRGLITEDEYRKILRSLTINPHHPTLYNHILSS